MFQSPPTSYCILFGFHEPILFGSSHSNIMFYMGKNLKNHSSMWDDAEYCGPIDRGDTSLRQHPDATVFWHILSGWYLQKQALVGPSGNGVIWKTWTMRWNSWDRLTVWDQYSLDLKNWFRTMRSFNRFELFIYNNYLLILPQHLSYNDGLASGKLTVVKNKPILDDFSESF